MDLELNKQEPGVSAEAKPENKLDRLANELENTNKILRTAYSWPHVIARGLLFGLATVVGTSVLAGLLFSVAREIFGIGGLG